MAPTLSSLTSSAGQIQWILFDLGHVVVDYQPGGTHRMARGLGLPVEQVEGRITDDLVLSAMTGRLSPDAFAETVSRELGVSLTARDVVDFYGPDVDHVFPEIPPLLRTLSAGYRLGVLSNTFFGHWDFFLEMPVATHFERLMASHTLGFLKPDERIYREALVRIESSPERVLFVDDKEENVAGARAVGLHAIHGPTPADTLAGLRRLGIPPP